MEWFRGWLGGKRGGDSEAPTPPPKRKAKAPQPATRHNTLAVCLAKGPNAYTETLEDGTIGGVGEKDGLSDEKLRQEAIRSRDAPAPTTGSPVVDATWEQWPRVLQPDRLGEGLPVDVEKLTADGKRWYEARWLPWQWTIYLQMMYWVQKARGVVPHCCLCLGFLAMATADALVRWVFRGAFGTMFLSNKSVVLVDRRLMEAAANHAWEMRQKFDLDSGVFVNVTTPENATNGVWVGGSSADEATCYSRKCTGVAKRSYTHLCDLQKKGLGGMVWTDLSASLKRDEPLGPARLREFVTKYGASEIFCAADVSPDDVSLALCADGAAAEDGWVQLVLPVWCEAAGTDVTMRLLTCRGLVDTDVDPDAEYCAKMCAAVDDMIEGSGRAVDRYGRTNLLFNANNPSSNGVFSWILADSYSSRKTREFVIALRAARKGSRALVAQTNDALEEVAAAERINLAALRADARGRDGAAKAVRAAVAHVGFGGVPKNAGFGDGMQTGFKRFLGDVKKRLRLTGCMGSANTTAHHPQIFTGAVGTAPMPAAGPPPGYALPPAPAAAPAPAAPQTPAAGGPRRFSTPMGQGAVDNQRGPPRNAPPSAQRLAFQTPQ